VFIGANGQGKTNLLEAVAMLALSSSPRARRDVEVVGPVAPAARIEAEVETGGSVVELAIALRVEDERAHRVIEVDGARRRAFDLPGQFRVTLFWPDDLGLIKSGPELRRRFLNQMLVQIEPGYARALAGLKRVLEQRNSLLKRIATGEAGSDVLDAWDEELIRIGGEVAAARSKAVRELEPQAARSHAEIASGERLEIEYLGPPADLMQAVHNSRAEDLKRGSTSIGPHRDDVRIMLDGRRRPFRAGRRAASGFASAGCRRRPGHHHCGRGGAVSARADLNGAGLDSDRRRDPSLWISWAISSRACFAASRVAAAYSGRKWRRRFEA